VRVDGDAERLDPVWDGQPAAGHVDRLDAGGGTELVRGAELVTAG